MDFHYYQWINSIIKGLSAINGSVIDGWTETAHKDTNTQWI